MSEESWIEVGSTDSIEEEDLIRFDHQDKTFCVISIISNFFDTIKSSMCSMKGL